MAQAEVPFPSFGVLNDVAVTTPAQAEVGLDIGKNLSYLNAPLEAERRYLFFTIGSGFDVAAKTDTATKQFEISVPAGQCTPWRLTLRSRWYTWQVTLQSTTTLQSP